MATSLGSRLRGGSADSKLIESSERSDRRENVIIELFAVMRKVMAELGRNKVYALQAKTEIAWFNQKLSVVNEEIKEEVRRSTGSVLHEYTGSMKQEETKGDAIG